MFCVINERLNIERQLVQAVCYDVARGASFPGDAMPSPHALSQELLLNLGVVESAYAKLVEVGILCGPMDGGYAIAEHAPRFAREYLLRRAQDDVKDLVDRLRRAGLSAEDVQRIFREVVDA